MAIRPERVGAPYPGLLYANAPRNVYWEMTEACDLCCRHCRASARPERDPAELTTAEAEALIRSVQALGSTLILTGGDPLMRPDLFELMSYARGLHVPLAITPSATPKLTEDVVERFSGLGIAALGLSLDGPSAAFHDTFRNVPGTFARSLDVLRWCEERRIPVQVNTTLTADTVPELPALYELLREHSPPVRRWSLFALIPVGRGKELRPIGSRQLDEVFEWVERVQQGAPFHVGTVEAPHYRRVAIQRMVQQGASMEQLGAAAGRLGFGVRDGNGVIFVSHTGEVFPAGFLPYPRLGNVRETPLEELYRGSPALLELRNPDHYKGRCGVCEFRWACGGSRARAYAVTGDPLESDPLCDHVPQGWLEAAAERARRSSVRPSSA